MCEKKKKIICNYHVLYLHKSKYSSVRPEQTYGYTNLGGVHHISLDISKIPCAAEVCVPKEDNYCCYFPSWPLIGKNKVSLPLRLSMNPTDRDDKCVLWLPPTPRPE